MKDQLLEYLGEFKSLMNFRHKDEQIKNIELFSGEKPASYYVPDIMGYLNYPPYSIQGESLTMAWFVEIWINGICVWRKSHINDDGGNLRQYEDQLIMETMREIVFSGLSSSYKFIKNRAAEKHNLGKKK